MPGDLAGRRALVTGAARGIGRDVALALARAGADVAVNYRERRADAAEVVREAEANGVRAVAIQADVSRGPEAAALVAQTAAALGPVDILVNNAGVAAPRDLASVTERDWDEAADVNLKSAFLVTQAALPAMRARGWGRLIFLSSVAAQVGGVVGPHYAASKAGMHGLMHYYARHLAREGITANCIAPALIDTDMVRHNLNARPDLIPVGRFGTTAEVAQAVLMIAVNGYVTGQVINVNGGWYFS